MLLFIPAAEGAFESGPGMRFESSSTYLRDAQGMYFQTQLQELQATLGATYTEGPWRAQLTGAWADWNPGGVWRGTNLEDTALDPFFWAWRQEADLSVAYDIWGGLSAGISLSDSSLRHYRSDDHFTYMQWRTRACAAEVSWVFFRAWGLSASAAASYAPWVSLEAYENTNIADGYPAVHQVNVSGTGTQLGGAVRVSYRHPWGIGAELVYDQGFSRFLNLGAAEEVSIRTGRLSGYLVFSF